MFVLFLLSVTEKAIMTIERLSVDRMSSETHEPIK
jgi:hypothetical protein